MSPQKDGSTSIRQSLEEDLCFCKVEGEGVGQERGRGGTVPTVPGADGARGSK